MDPRYTTRKYELQDNIPLLYCYPLRQENRQESKMAEEEGKAKMLSTKDYLFQKCKILATR